MTGMQDQSRPDPRTVADFHTNDDLDQDDQSHHHSLGVGRSQASPGSHTHNGSDSFQLLSEIEIVGSRGGNTALASVIAALVGMGAKDSTTA
jgi:hypothetical protein